MRFPKVNIFGATDIFSVSREVHEEIKNYFVRGTSAAEKGGLQVFHYQGFQRRSLPF